MDNMISLNLPNIVTITIMGAVGFMVLALVAQGFHAAANSAGGN